MNTQVKSINILSKAFLSLVFLLHFTYMNVSAQEMWGYANSNYSGLMGIHLNPAKIVGTPYEWEVNVLAADIFYDNNYIYLPKLSAVNTKTTTAEDGTTTNPTTFVVYTSPESKHAFVNARILGPGFIKNSGNSAWAVHSAMRVIASANGVPSALVEGFSTNFDYGPLHNSVFKDMKLNAAGMAFAEVGFTYGKVHKNTEQTWLAWGATLNGLIGFDGMYLHASAGDFSIPDSSSLYLNNVNLNYGHAFGEGQSPRGYGASADLGIVYIHKRVTSAYECGKAADKKKRYQYKLGFSLIDFGVIGFNHDASSLKINDGSLHWSYLDTAKFNTIEDFDRQLIAHSSGAGSSNHFGMFTPAAASVQFDYCFMPRWYAALDVVQRVPISNREVYRANSISLAPRYERSKFEASLSANMYEYEHVYLGAALRYSFFILGTDRLSSFLGSDVRSMNVFFGFKFNSCMLVKKVSNKGKCPING